MSEDRRQRRFDKYGDERASSRITDLAERDDYVMLGELQSARWIHIKGWLFLLMGIIAAALVLVELPTWRVGLLLAICIWAFCRFYYYAFYVIEKYVDPSYKFAGLLAFLRWWLTSRHKADD